MTDENVTAEELPELKPPALTELAEEYLRRALARNESPETVATATDVYLKLRAEGV